MKAVAAGRRSSSSESAMTSNSWRVKLALGLVEGGGAGELPDRERRQRFGLVGGADRLAALGRLEVVAFALVDDQRERDRADRDRGDDGKSEPEAEAHGPLVGRRRAAPQSTGAFASDSQR